MNLTISVNTQSSAESFALQNALQQIASNFSKENISYIAELSKKPGVNDKFSKLKNNPFVKTLL